MNIDFSFVENFNLKNISESLEKATSGSAGFDLYANLKEEEEIVLFTGDIITVGTGIKLRIPNTMVGMVCSRSGLAQKGVFVVNSPGIIDSDYRGEIKVILCNIGKESFIIKSGMRIAQLIFFNYTQSIYLNKVDKILSDETERGEKGFGSTGVFSKNLK